jgi:hypothetical protein
MLVHMMILCRYHRDRCLDYGGLTHPCACAGPHVFLNSSRTSCIILLYLLSEGSKGRLHVHPDVARTLRILQDEGAGPLVTSMRLLAGLVLGGMNERALLRCACPLALI